MEIGSVHRVSQLMLLPVKLEAGLESSSRSIPSRCTPSSPLSRRVDPWLRRPVGFPSTSLSGVKCDNFKICTKCNSVEASTQLRRIHIICGGTLKDVTLIQHLPCRRHCPSNGTSDGIQGAPRQMISSWEGGLSWGRLHLTPRFKVQTSFSAIGITSRADTDTA